MRIPHPPLTLTPFKGSFAAAKIQHATALLTLLASWVNEVQDMDLDTALDGLAAAKRLRRKAKELESTFEIAALSEMYHSGQHFYRGQGYSAFLRNGSKRTHWKHAAVMDALIESTVERTQERFPYVPAATARAIVNEAMWEVHKRGRVEWRSSDLREAGVDPDEHSTTGVEPDSVDLRGEASYTRAMQPRRRAVRV